MTKAGLGGLTAAVWAVVGLAGCGPAATDRPGAPAATPGTNQLACTAMALASRGEWSQAQAHWLAAEEHATANMDATSAFYLLVTDSAAVATDQLTGAPQAADIATYKTDLAGDSAYTAGC